jgi:glutathione reductase (NADPH)
MFIHQVIVWVRLLFLKCEMNTVWEYVAADVFPSLYEQIVDPHTVSVDGKLYTAKNILVAVGGRPSIPNIHGIEHVIDSDAALDLPSKPEKIAIVGGGYIALEFAGIFNGLKSEVHVFIRQKKVLRGFDEEVGI